MAPLKFEESIKEKLEERTIQPSQGSWDKLADQLDGENEEESSFRSKWLFAAASIVGLVILTSVFMTSGEANKFDQHQIVDTTIEVDQIINKSEVVEVVEHKLIPDTKNALDQTEESKAKKRLSSDELIIKRSIKQQVSHKDAVASNEVKKENLPFKDVQIIDEKENTLVVSEIEEEKTIKEEIRFPIATDVIKEKLNEVLAQVKELEEGKDNVTSDEINILLYEAQKEILIQQVNANSVNASALLLDVELELDESFKQRVFEALKAGFQKLKTSVAERDN